MYINRKRYFEKNKNVENSSIFFFFFFFFVIDLLFRKSAKLFGYIVKGKINITMINEAHFRGGKFRNALSITKFQNIY